MTVASGQNGARACVGINDDNNHSPAFGKTQTAARIRLTANAGAFLMRVCSNPKERYDSPKMSSEVRRAIVLSLMACLIALVSRGDSLGFLVPAYFYPVPNGAWETLNRTALRVPLIAILNPNSGPGTSAENNYRQAISNLHSAGGRVIGYVHTSYGARLLSDVKEDVDRYLSFYSVDGFFIDEMDNRNLPLSYGYYADLYQYIKANNAAFIVVGNPGTTTREEYLTGADMLVTFENNTGYDTYVPDRWTTNYPASRFAHLPYAVSSGATMTNYIQLARARNVGFIFVTDDLLPNPWDRLPEYWEAEVSLLQELNRPRLAITLDNQHTIRLEVHGAPGLRSVLEASTNLTQWTPLSTNQPGDGKYVVTNSSAGPFSRRFYRAKQ
jgi:hypothetical protein